MKKIILILGFFTTLLFSSSYEDGLKAYKNSDFKTALLIFEELALKDDLKAQSKLGFMYLYAKGVNWIKKCLLTWGHSKGRVARYVVASRNDGVFNVNILNQITNNFENKDLKLSVCKNCLNNINWTKVSSKIFDLDAYFQYFPKFLNQGNHKKDYEIQINDYPTNWKDISINLRERKKWKCEKCDLDCSNNKIFLHVHHINGLKYDNVDSNLKILCKNCHSKEPGHEHLL